MFIIITLVSICYHYCTSLIHLIKILVLSSLPTVPSCLSPGKGTTLVIQEGRPLPLFRAGISSRRGPSPSVWLTSSWQVVISPLRVNKLTSAAPLGRYAGKPGIKKGASVIGFLFWTSLSLPESPFLTFSVSFHVPFVVVFLLLNLFLPVA